MEKCTSCRFYKYSPMGDNVGDAWSPHRCTRFITFEVMPLSSPCGAELVQGGRCPYHQYWEGKYKWYKKLAFWLLGLEEKASEWWKEDL